jgi:hypothetical protein
MDRNSPTTELEDEALRLWSVNPYPSAEDFSRRFIRAVMAYCKTHFAAYPVAPITVALLEIAEHFYEGEQRCKYLFTARERFDDPVERGRYRDALLNLIKVGRETPESWLVAFIDHMLFVYDPFIRALPEWALVPKLEVDAETTAPTALIIEHIDDVGAVVDKMITHSFIEFPYSSLILDALKQHLIELGEKVQGRGDPIMADEYRGPPHEIVNRFLGADSPLGSLFYTAVPLPQEEPEEDAVPEPPEISLSVRFQGQWVIGTQGTGKTQLLQLQLSRDLDMVAQGKASIVVLDPTGDKQGRLIHNLITLKRFAPGGDLHGTLIYIDPQDRGYTLPINLLSLRANFDDEESIGSAISSYLSIMGGLMGQPLTSFQEPVFRYAVQAALAFPNPTLATLRDILQPNAKIYEQVLPKLHPDVRAYFQQVYDTEGPRRSRSEILNRLFTLSSDPKFRRLFSATETKIDFFDEINQPKVIVINASRDYLQSLTELYGRYFLALITGAGERRASMAMGTPIPCFIYIDECDEFVANDPNASKILLKLRGMRIALILGNQLVSRITDSSVQESFLGTAIKFVNANSASARALAEEMNLVTEAGRIDTSFLVARPALNFAFHIRGQMPKPIAVQVPYGVLESQPHMTDAELAQVRGEIRTRYYVPSDAAAGRPPAVQALSDEPEQHPAQLLAAAYQQLAAHTQRGEWEKIRRLKASIALLEARVDGLQGANDLPRNNAQLGKAAADTQNAPEPQRSGNGSTEGSSDWR